MSKIGVDIFCLAFAKLDDAVEYKARRNTVGNAIAECHKHACKECGDRFVEIGPFDILESRHHHNSDQRSMPVRLQLREQCRQSEPKRWLR